MIGLMEETRTSVSPPNINVVRFENASQEAIDLINEYFEAIQVVVRETPSKLRKLTEGPKAGVWVVYVDGEAMGCVVLRDLPGHPDSAECKRLYVRPQGRGLGLADRLLDAMEDYAKEIGVAWIYLDTHDGLQAAVHVYQKRGYVSCERYNDNPQATVFMRKALD